MKRFMITISTLLFMCTSLYSQESDLHFTLLGGSFYSPANRVEMEIDGLRISAKHGNAFAFGGRVTNWINPIMGIEASINYSQSPLEGGDIFSGNEIRGALLFSALKFVFATNEARQVQFGVGFGLVSSDYDYDLEGDTHPAGVLSLTFSNPISDNLALYIGVEDYLHTVYWTIGDVQTGEIFQNDLLIGIGLSIYK